MRYKSQLLIYVKILRAVHKLRHGLKGRGYQGFYDNSTCALLLKSVTMGGGKVKNYQKLRDTIYGRPLSSTVR
jgi:hypothetical protein